MTDSGLPCLDLLEATPGILGGRASELTDDDAGGSLHRIAFR
jgi:hypothetical protein